MNGLIAAGFFLFSLVFSTLSFVLWVRIALRYFHVSALHSISQLIYRFTEPLISPVSRILHVSNIRTKRYDWPCVAVLVMIEIIKFLLINFLFFKNMFSIKWLILYPLADLIIQPLNFLFYAILFRVIMSWVNPLWQNPIHELLIVITEPVLRHARRYIPQVTGLDLSPVVVLIVIKVISLFISASLPFYLL